MKPISSDTRQPTNTSRAVGTRIAVRRILLGLLASTTLATAGTAAASQPTGYHFDTLASIPQAAPGLAGQYQIRDFEADALSDTGWAIYAGDFAASPTPYGPTGIPTGEGIWLQHGADEPIFILATGQPDPEGVLFGRDGTLGPNDVNNSGDAVIGMRLAPAPVGVDSSLNSGIYRYDRASGTLRTLAKTGSVAPGGLGTFAGFRFVSSLSNNGEILFHGIYETASGTYAPPALAPKRFGAGLFHADKKDVITALVLPGDPAPSGGTFDNIRNGWVSENHDIVFGGHTSLDSLCTGLSCGESIYLRSATTGVITSLAHVGDIAPIAPIGDWKYEGFVFGPRINASGAIVFTGALKNTVTGTVGRGIFLRADGSTQAIAWPGSSFDADGDTFTVVQTSLNVHNYFINDAGAVSFTAVITGDRNADGRYDSGAFVWRDGAFQVVAKTADVIPDVGTVSFNHQPAVPAALLTVIPAAGSSAVNTNGRAMINNRGQVLLVVTLSDGTGKLLLATP